MVVRGAVVTFRYHCSLVLRRSRDFPIRYFHIDHNVSCLPPKFCIIIAFPISLGYNSRPKRNKKQKLCNSFIEGEGGGGGVNKEDYENGK